MNSIRRSCHSALINSNSICRISNGTRRAFSQSTTCQRGSLPTFHEPSTPELSALLSTLNSKVLLPKHLNHDQQLLVYREKNRTRLEAEPIYITLGQVTLPLEHIDRNCDQPDRWRTINDIIRNSSTPSDWENVLRMVEGFHDASIRLKPMWKEKIVRKFNEAGMQHLVLKALQRVERTGLSLKDKGVTGMVFKGIRDKAEGSGWEKEETRKALNLAEQVVELMESKEHLGRTNAMPGDLRASPFVIAVPLELAAVRAKRHTEGQDRDGKVAKYALRIMNALKQDDFLAVTLAAKSRELDPPREYPTAKAKHTAFVTVRKTMYEMIPLWNAIKTAIEVLGSEMPMAEDAKKVTGNIRKALTSGETTLKELSNKEVEQSPEYVNRLIRECEEL
ncbi:hypothetical protein K469DRAFT_718825 [Zopfia rhizophila CBS 207.26]|uniref:Uncharacterized protein n=1 Tax=Zopfia rhizophila CBS 207.26 TaxID=1314779 RepID=A0A6A6EIB6_9PEZI|nr:hypothetical protein K469DRAFT_718825 [Zopfia rhizophila CBS 207.26]